MSFTDAAEAVLKQEKEQTPLHYREITERALSAGLIATSGRTPEATMYSMIITEIDRHTRRGEQARFVKHGRGVVGLRRWMGKGLAMQIDLHNREVRKKLRKQLQEMKAAEFETLMGHLLARLGFESVQVTSLQNDKGIDVRGVLVVGEVIRSRLAVQVKKWKHNIHAPVVQQLRGSLGAHEQGLIITTSAYSSGAVQEANRPDAVPVALMDGEQLVKLMVEYELGVHRTAYDLIELGEPEDE